ncbi:MAG TPA: hypothetical protein VFB22_16160 [Candidatus Baltobacteraceae bacterium]|nr:hypothetical protein [Candidatus Baltobacteraceae bacterium]
MNTTQAAVPPRSGLATAVDVVIAPTQAFERLRVAPTWGWAFLIAVVLGMVGFALTIPAALHALQVGGPALFASSPQFQNLPADKQQQAISNALAFTRVITQLQWIFVPIVMLIGSLIGTVVMLIANAIAHGEGTFKKLWALSINVGIVSVGIGLLLTGIICVVRGPASFTSTTDVQRALPSLALFAGSAGVKMKTFLAAFNVVQLWGTALLGLGMQGVARIGAPVAWGTAIVMLVGSAAIGASFAR